MEQNGLGLHEQHAGAEPRAAAPRWGLVFACYGTSQPDLAAHSVGPLAQAAHRALCEKLKTVPANVPLCVAYTSAKVRRKLANAGTPVLSPGEALEQLAAQGVTHAAAASSHLVEGDAYQQVRAAALRMAPRFAQLVIAAPLFSSMADLTAAAEVLSARYPRSAGRAVVLVGHGAAGAGQLAYAALDEALRLAGRDDMVVGTLRLRPCVDDVLTALARGGVRRVLLVPLMLAAGAHVARDIAGAHPESWRARLEAAGFAVEVAQEGLAELPVTRELVVRHLLAAEAVPARYTRGAPARQIGEEAAPPLFARQPGETVGPCAPRFPLFVGLGGKRCLVVGAGAVGMRRAQALARFGARVTVVDPRAEKGDRAEGGREPVAPAGAGAVDLLARVYRPGEEEGCALVVAATNDRAVNKLVGERCRAAGIPVSVADAADECTFFFPALAEAPGVVCGIVSTDNNHAHVARAAQAVRAALGCRLTSLVQGEKNMAAAGKEGA